MNENIDLTKILKDCPEGWKFYSSIYDDVEFVEILPDVPVTCGSQEDGWCLPEVIKRKYPIKIKDSSNIYTLSSAGRYRYGIGECIFFPSKDQIDWSKFTAPWYNPEKHGKEEYGLKSSKDEDVRKFMQYIKKQAKAYEFNLPNRDYDIYAFAKDLLVWLEKQGKKSSWKPSKEEMDVLYSLSYITNKYDEHKEDVITHLYQDLKREFFNDSSYENMFSLDNKEDDVRRRSTIQVLEYARSLDAYNQYGKADIDKNIAWLKEQGEQEEPQVYKTEDGNIITYSETDGYKFVEPNFHENERAWLYLVSDVLTWKDGIGQYLDDPRVQEIAKRLCSEYAQKLYSPSNSSNTRKNEQKSADKIEPKFKVGDWVVDNCGYVWKIEGRLNQFYILEGVEGGESRPTIDWVDKTFHFWTFQDAKDGDVVQLGTVTAIFKKYIGEEKCICYCSFCKDGGFEIPIENGDDNVYGCYNATPSTKEQRDVLMKTMNDAGYEWDIEKKELKKLVPNRFDPKTLKPFDKVLVRRGSEDYNVWFPDFVSDPPNATDNKTLCMCVMEDIAMVIPYNDYTKHLIGTAEEAPEYYRYW